jgi:hypothetical protein
MAEQWNKIKALDDLLVMFKDAEKNTFSESMNMMMKAQNFLDEIYLQGVANGFEAGIKKIEIDNDSN